MSELNRKKTLLVGTISTYGAIGVSIAVGLASVPIGLHYFGPVRYGIWFVIGSILAYLRKTDFGIGLSALTFISHTTNPSQQRGILRRSIGLLTVASVILITATIIFTYTFSGWIGILGKIPLSLQKESSSALLAIIVLTLFQLPEIGRASCRERV